ncbi:RDD family protein, partial [Agromyces allii]
MSITMHVDDEPTPGLGPDGRPDPAYAAALGLVPAPTGRRSAAFTIDAAIWIVLAAPTIFGAVALSTAVLEAGGDASTVDLAGLSGPLIAIAVGQALTAVFGLIQLISHGLRGVTVGKAALGIRSVSVVDFGKAGFWRIALRALVLWLSWVVLLAIGPALMFLSSNWDPERRGRSWLDRIGRSYAVDARHGLDPFDAKAMRHAQRLLASPREQGSVKPPSLASDRPAGEEFLIPSQRSSSGVVSAGGSVDTGQWAPPPVGATAPPAPGQPGQPAPGLPSPLPPMPATSAPAAS